MKRLRVIISGGGTGGHIFPAISIAKSIEISHDNVEILFVGAIDRMEMKKVPECGYKIEGLWISGFQRSFSLKNLLFPFKLIVSLIKARKIISNFNPDLVIGTGGFASGPLLYVASRRGIPSLIQEQNSYPGITNKLLSRYVDKVCVAYDGMEKFFPINKLFLLGNPIRDEMLNLDSKRKKGKFFFNVDNDKTTILVLGGSLGARTINESIFNNLHVLINNNLNVIWQTGIDFEKKSKSLVDQINKKGIVTFPFIKDIATAYAASDIIVSRAGAISISELCCVGKPVILVPSPNVAEDHQKKNAQSLVNKKSALMVEDVNANIKLVDKLVDLSNNLDLQRELSINIKRLSVQDASEKIAEISLNMVKE